MIRSGKLTCPKCGRNKKNGWLEWQNKGDKWIFFWRGDFKGTHYNDNWYSTWGGPGIGNVQDCWGRGGSTKEQWNNWDIGNNCWICDYCNYCSSNFLDFIHLGGGKHICPYGCGRMIPDGYQGCTELLKEFPNYAF